MKLSIKGFIVIHVYVDNLMLASIMPSYRLSDSFETHHDVTDQFFEDGHYRFIASHDYEFIKSIVL